MKRSSISSYSSFLLGSRKPAFFLVRNHKTNRQWKPINNQYLCGDIKKQLKVAHDKIRINPFARLSSCLVDIQSNYMQIQHLTLKTIQFNVTSFLLLSSQLCLLMFFTKFRRIYMLKKEKRVKNKIDFCPCTMV